MYFRQLLNSGLAGVNEWASMWNQHVLPYLRSQRLVAGRGIRINETPSGTRIEVVDASGHAAGSIISSTIGYDSYFNITLAQPTSRAAVVTVADGATGGENVAVVNGGGTWSISAYTETISSGALYLLKYTPAQYGSGGAVVSGATMVISSLHQSGGSIPSLPSGGTSGAFYYQLGRVIWSSGGQPPRVVQDHTGGVVYFNWFANCYLG